MRTVIIGGGRRCRAIIELARGPFFKELPLDILSVADPDRNAPGMEYAREHGIRTTTNTQEALSTPGIDLVVELTGNDVVLRDIYEMMPRRTRILDHMLAKILIGLANAQKDQARQLQEITQLEKQIDNERLFLESIFDTMPQLVAVLDRSKRLTRINVGLSQFSGFSPEEAVGQNFANLLAETELSLSCAQTDYLLDSVMGSNQSRTFIWQSPPPGKTVWEITHTPILRRGERAEEVLCTWHRITEHAILQHKIDAAELRFQNFIDSAHDWISVKDLEGRYMIVNRIAAESLNLTPGDFIGKKPEEILPPNLAKTIRTHDKQVIEGDCYRAFTEIVPIDGRDQHFQTNRFPLKDFKGNTIGVCTIMRNVTSEITLRRQLEQTGRLAAIGKLAAGVAHEINNPLTGILAYAEDLMGNTPVGTSHHDDLFVIIQETLRCREIVKNLLDFSLQERPDFQPLEPNSVVTRALRLVEKLPQFRNIAIEKHLRENIPSTQGDPNQIEQVILNFMMNAAEAMKGKGTITVISKHDEREGKAIITVEDDGPGIPENLKDRIFEPFFSTKGTNGLGLAVSWGIIVRHLGAIEVEISASGGASFSIILPIMDDQISLDNVPD